VGAIHDRGERGTVAEPQGGSAHEDAAELAARDDMAAEIAQLRDGLVTRTVIGQATGIVAGRLQVSTDAAWQLLRRASGNTNRKLRRVAEAIVATHDGRPGEDDARIAQDVAHLVGEPPTSGA
jgi:hypothetical protein